MAGKFYAVRKGKKTGIYLTWNECKEQIQGVAGAEYKGFKTKEEAEEYMNRFAQSIPADAVEIYVDGSYDQKSGDFSYGMVVLKDGEELKFANHYSDEKLAGMHNVAGELKGAEAAMRYAVDHSIKDIVIYHDYAGIAYWCLGEWKTNKEGTKAYKDFYNTMTKKVNVFFKKVAGHSGDQYNDMVDMLAKQALGLVEQVYEYEEY